MTQLIVGDVKRRANQAGPALVAESLLLAGFGIAFVLIGGVDLAFAWFPPQIGDREWEFGTLSRTFDGLALLTVGWTAITGAAMLRGAKPLLRGLSITFLVGVLVLLAMAALYAINIPPALQAMPAGAVPVLKKTALRTGSFAGIYIMLYGFMCVVAWRYSRTSPGGEL